MSGVEFTPFELFAIALAVTLGIGLLAVWRENTWHARMEILRSDFGRELKKRDDEIIRLSARLDARDDDVIRLMERVGLTINAGGDATIGGGVAGRDGAR